MNNESRHLVLIEIIRFLAALSVLVWHYQNFTFVNFQHIDLVVEKQPFYAIFWPFYERGLLGVQVFWAVSGFIFFWKYKALLAERLIDAKKFFILRFSRLYPLHIVTLLVVSLLQYLYFLKAGTYFSYHFFDIPHFLPHLIMASNWISPDLSFNGPIWSVSCEVVVYVFFYFYVSRFNPSIKTTFIIFIICSLLSAFHIDHNVTNCLKYFLLGGLSFELAMLMGASKNKAKFDRNLILMIVLSMAMLFLAYQFDIVRFKHYTFVLLILIPFALYFAPINININEKFASAISGLGNLTYSSYLTHFPIQLIMVNWFAYQHASIPFYQPWFLVLYLVVVLVISYFTYNLFERPAQKYIRDRMLQQH